MSDAPRALYKYVPPARIDILERRLVRFTPADLFNDPFELGIVATTLATAEELESLLSTADWKELIREQLDELPGDAIELFGREALERLALAHLPTLKREVTNLSAAAAPTVMSGVRRAFFEKVGILSLSEVPDDLLMWAHYTRSHEGFVMEFNPKHGVFWRRRGPNDELYFVRRVAYSEVRPIGSMYSAANAAATFPHEERTVGV